MTEKFTILLGGTKVGAMTVITDGNEISIDYGYKNNGRGPDSLETLKLSETGAPVDWSIKGKTTFGNEVDERFSISDGVASWKSAAGEGTATYDGEAIYIDQNASVYSQYVYAKALLQDEDQRLPALPAGEIRIKEVQRISLQSSSEKVEAMVYALSGIDLNPSYVVLDMQQQFMAYMAPRCAVLREGFEQEDEKVRDLAAELNVSRFEEISKRATHKYQKPVRIKNVRIFDPMALALSEPKSVLISGEIISAVEEADISKSGEVIIDGAGGSLIPGLFEMHGHMGDNQALLNVMAGVTSVRDVGNEIEVLDPLIEKIESNVLIGPRITKSGFIEGKSEFSSATGEIAETEEQAVQLVRDYAARGNYFQIKIYSSIKGEWVPAMAAEAHKQGLRVAGHIPAFSNADQMIEAGYDEITHINQLMLGWVLKPEEDTRTLYRITGMKRFVDLDLSSDKVQKTINTMVEKNIVIDPTTVIHELGLMGRNGTTRAGVRDYIEHMPVAIQRQAKSALLNVADAKEDADYSAAYTKVIETLALIHQRGILIVPGTDLGGAFELHRELELFQEFGMSPAEILRRGSFDMANYLGQGDQLGSIEAGKLADFFLVPGDPTTDIKAIKTISMVSRDGDIYFPTQVYPEFGIKPFTEMPTISEPTEGLAN
jgi:imidazolonepropionase-like amidohydrolase